MKPITLFTSPDDSPLPTATVASETVRAIVFVAVELAAATRLTGWRRAGILAIAAHNVVRTVRTGRAVHQLVQQQREAEEAPRD